MLRLLDFRKFLDASWGLLVRGFLVRGRCLCRGAGVSALVLALGRVPWGLPLLCSWFGLPLVSGVPFGAVACGVLAPWVSCGALWCPVVSRPAPLARRPGVFVFPPLVGVVRGSLGSAGCGLLFFRVRRVRSPGPPGSVLGPGLGTPTG